MIAICSHYLEDLQLVEARFLLQCGLAASVRWRLLAVDFVRT